MKWRKLGKIFDPTQHALPHGCHEFAQSPQALVLDDGVRIFFSSRSRDPEGSKYVSHVPFVDMSKDLRRVCGIATQEVIALGGPGCFDEHGIFPLNVVPFRGEILGYTCGWSRRISVPVETSIGFARSRDGGRTFQKEGAGPILTASLHEPFLVGDPFVLHREGAFHMWYIFGTEWRPGAGSPDRIYKIGHAQSPDGVTWQKEEARRVIADRLGPDECQALPSVSFFQGSYHMVFCYRQASDFRTNPRRAYRLGYARSEDLAHWTRADQDLGIDVSPGEWDSDMMCYPNLFRCDGAIYLLYNGNEFGRRGFGLAVLE